MDSDDQKKILQGGSVHEVFEVAPLRRRSAIPIAVLLGVVVLLPITGAIDLRLHRDFGTRIGGKIKGTFSARVKDAEGAERVEFYLDDELVATTTDEPFRWVFKTEDYPEGEHVIRAIAFFVDGEPQEDTVTTSFVTSFGPWWTLYIWGTIVFVVGIVIFAIWQAKRESGRPQGKTRCPQCDTVFERQWSPMHKGNAYRNTCPTCSKKFWADRIDDERET